MTDFDINNHIVFLGIFRFTNNMYQTIHEPIIVAGVFKQASFRPVWFEWQQQRFPVEEITLTSELQHGSVRKIMYSVLADGDLYRLDYCPSNHHWQLAAIWVEN